MQCVWVQSIWTKDASGWDEGGRRDWKFTVDANLVGFYRQTERRDFEWCVHRGGEKGKRGAVAVCLRSIRGERERSGLGNVVTTYWIARPGWIASPLFSAPVIFPSNVSSGGVGWGGGERNRIRCAKKKRKNKRVGWGRQREIDCHLSLWFFFLSLFLCVSVWKTQSTEVAFNDEQRVDRGRRERDERSLRRTSPPIGCVIVMQGSCICRWNGWMDGWCRLHPSVQSRRISFLI